jgi:hypothetical protein
MATRLEHVERISGKGRLAVGGHIYSVGYVIDVYQKYFESTPLLASARGRLAGMSAAELRQAISLKALDLELEDARHAQIILKNPDGDFDVTGPIAAPEPQGE